MRFFDKKVNKWRCDDCHEIIETKESPLVIKPKQEIKEPIPKIKTPIKKIKAKPIKKHKPKPQPKKQAWEELSHYCPHCTIKIDLVVSKDIYNRSHLKCPKCGYNRDIGIIPEARSR